MVRRLFTCEMQPALSVLRVCEWERERGKYKANPLQTFSSTHIGLALGLVLMLHCLKRHGQIASLGQLIGKHEHDALVQRGAERFDHLGRHKVAIDVGEGARIVDDATRIMGHR